MKSLFKKGAAICTQVYKEVPLVCMYLDQDVEYLGFWSILPLELEVCVVSLGFSVAVQ